MMRSMRAAALTAALLIGTGVTAGAQGGPPGGGGGMGGGRRSPDAMALLEKPLAGVDGLTAAQKDSLTKIETMYKAKFTESSTAMREAMAAARQSGGPPDMAAMTKARDGMKAMRAEELGLARAVLTPAQHPKFDENVKAEAAEAAEREAQMRQRMGGNPPE